MPDEVDRPAPAGNGAEPLRAVDLADDLAVFVERYGASPWVGDDGYPASWLIYQLGRDTIARENARDALRTYGATGAVHAKDYDRQRWHRETKMYAGWG